MRGTRDFDSLRTAHRLGTELELAAASGIHRHALRSEGPDSHSGTGNHCVMFKSAFWGFACFSKLSEEIASSCSNIFELKLFGKPKGMSEKNCLTPHQPILCSQTNQTGTGEKHCSGNMPSVLYPIPSTLALDAVVILNSDSDSR